VPGARKIEGQDARKVDAEEALQIGAICCDAAPTSVWSRNSSAIAKKNQAQDRCAGVSLTRSGGRNEIVCRSIPCQPKKLQRPNTANSRPMPPSSAMSERTLHTTASAVRRFSTSGPGGQLFVYE
jgi:hypothetical protein